jgi:NADP-dependent 3-hydroxy acid dehydrogenase YdfG
VSSGDVKDWKEIFDVNVIALAVCTKTVVKDLVEKEVPGSVIHISSLSGHRIPVMTNTGAGTNGMYSASKFAVRALTESLRQELRSIKSRIRVCEISPVSLTFKFISLKDCGFLGIC